MDKHRVVEIPEEARGNMICFLNLAEAVPKGVPSCACLRWLTEVRILHARRQKEELNSSRVVSSPVPIGAGEVGFEPTGV